MTQFEKDRIKSWMRKLARITSELNELAFEMADFDGGDYKSKAYDCDVDPRNCEPAPAYDKMDDKYVEEPTARVMTVGELADIRAEAIARKDSGDKLKSLMEKVAQLENIIANESTSAKTRTISKKKLQALRGHVSRHLKSKEEVPWKSQVK
jgi:hypothetical protein